jgi:protein SCO1/2
MNTASASPAPAHAAPVRPAGKPIGWPTLLSCLFVFGAFVASTAFMTRAFEQWTFEDLRVARAARGELIAPPTQVRTSKGARETLFDGRDANAVYLVDFIYTTCTTVCQSLGSEYFRMQQALVADAGSRVRLLSLSFDVSRDTQADLNRYALTHRADASRWTIAAPASDAKNRELLHRLGVVAIADGFGGYVHNGSIHLIDGLGVVRGIYDFEQWPAALAAARMLGEARR